MRNEPQVRWTMRSKTPALCMYGCITPFILGIVTTQSNSIAETVSYDASLNTLPDAQGWTLNQNDSGSATPVASNGILYQGPTSVIGQQFWNSVSTPIPDFEGTSQFSMTAELKVLQSDYEDNGSQWRSGYSVFISDEVGQLLELGISDTAVRLSVDGNTGLDSFSGPLVSLNTTSQFHTYQVDIVSGVGSLFVDGSFITSLAIATAQPYPNLSDVLFGDGTRYEGSQTELRYLDYTTNTGTIPQLTVPPGVTFPPIRPGSGPGISVIIKAGITIGAGGIQPIGPATTHANRNLLVVTAPGLSIAGSAGNWTGLLDLSNNDMDLPGASLTTVTDQIRQGYNNGNWNGTGGIISSSAASDSTHLTALGVIRNIQSGSPLFTSFDTYAVGASDVLVKYTYVGDANLDGKVDGSDYSLIDNGYLKKMTGWYNGDFNYDGVVDGSDYTLIDNAFNTQGADLTAQIAGMAAVPESGTVGTMSIVALAFLGRRRRPRSAGLAEV
jgi:hypothetical protein